MTTSYMEHIKEQIAQGIRKELFPQYDKPEAGWVRCESCNGLGDNNNYSMTPDPCEKCVGRGIRRCDDCGGYKFGDKDGWVRCWLCVDGFVQHDCDNTANCWMVDNEDDEDGPDICIEDRDGCEECQGDSVVPCAICNNGPVYKDYY